MKLSTSEEVLSEVLPQEEHGEEFFLCQNPIVITESHQVDSDKGVVMSGLMPRKWMLYSNQELCIVYKRHVVSISELDKFGVDFYRKALIAARISSPIKKRVETKNSTGFIGEIDKMRKRLDSTFNDSPDLTSDK